jgi:hypothetical protein
MFVAFCSALTWMGDFMVNGLPAPAVNGTYVDVAFPGARLNYAVPRVLARAGLLRTFYTDGYIGNKPWLQRALKHLPAALIPALVGRFLGRQAADIPTSKVISFDQLGMKRALLMLRRRSWTELRALHVRLDREFCESVVRMGLHGATAIYGVKSSCLEIFQAAKKEGIRCIMEQNSAPQPIEAKLLRSEAESWPGWDHQLSADFSDGPLSEREQAEWALADCIVCPSEFVAKGLQSLGVSPAKCRLVPYPFDSSGLFSPDRSGRGERLNVLFVGYVSLRKGVPYLLEAVRKLNSPQVRCRLVGAITMDAQCLARYAKWVEVVGPMPRLRIGSEFRWADVLVFPSVSEAFGLVTCEAFACGVPVIATPNSGSIVSDGKDGFIVPLRDSEAIANCLERLLRDRELLRAMSVNALHRSRGFGLEAYGERILRETQLVHDFAA